MRPVIVTALVAAFVAAAGCASSSNEEPCRIEGTYTATGTLESGNCPLVDGPVTDTLTKLPDGRYRLEIQGTTGGCDLDLVDTCKVQGKCFLDVKDVVNPGDRGTVQYSWSFTRDGFSGLSAVTVPPAASLPAGCSATAKVIGKRR